MKWWNTQLFVIEKKMTRMTKIEQNDIEKWITLLRRRFKKSSNIVMKTLIKKKYIIRDAINRREFREYAQKILRLIKDVDLILIKNQLDFIFNNIDLNVRSSNIRRSKNEITLNDFLENINDFKYDWWKREIKHRFEIAKNKSTKQK